MNIRALILATSVVLLGACSSPQEQLIDFTPEMISPSSANTAQHSIVISSRDTRKAQYVAVIDTGKSRFEPIHAKQNIRTTLEKTITNYFASQGYQSTKHSDNTIEIELKEALVSVRHSVLENEMTANITLSITAETPNGKLVRTYKGNTNQTSALSALNSDISELLNNTMNLVLKEMSQDKKLQHYMKERF
ncbi:YajG family lipoprotein [Vibrio sp.]|nr:YajG family lipoprotein [Vibrio sp.]